MFLSCNEVQKTCKYLKGCYYSEGEFKPILRIKKIALLVHVTPPYLSLKPVLCIIWFDIANYLDIVLFHFNSSLYKMIFLCLQ